MYSLLLALIYLAFISLGLPDSLLGSAWPNIQSTVQVPTSYGGILSFLITASTILSSLGSGRMMRRFGTGGTACLSVALTAAALLGFSVSNHFFALCLWAVPYGLGAGSVDAVLNHYVALHYKAKHMSWLHCFWGIGATGGPYIMGLCLSSGMGWQSGYRVIFGIQFVFTLILLLSLFPVCRRGGRSIPSHWMRCRKKTVARGLESQYNLKKEWRNEGIKCREVRKGKSRPLCWSCWSKNRWMRSR